MPIALTGFMDHVQKMHAEDNKGFLAEYQVCMFCVCELFVPASILVLFVHSVHFRL